MVLATSAWRAERNAKARARLMRHLPDVFPPVVLAHALAKPFVPPTPRRAIESYWRHHPVRADKLARALAWPQLLAFWGVPNLQVVNRSAHATKCAQESGDRAQRRATRSPADLPVQT